MATQYSQLLDGFPASDPIIQPENLQSDSHQGTLANSSLSEHSLDVTTFSTDWYASSSLGEFPLNAAFDNNPSTALIDHPGNDEVSFGHCPAGLTFESFFLNNGAWKPPMPCTHCKKMRLQCFMIQTTSANPNPVSSCSSCVALFRTCSLAERQKRGPSQFETAEPVIGQLHGLNEELNDLNGFLSTDPIRPVIPETTTSTSKRASSRSIGKTKALRTWFANHMDEPYPSEEEKAELVRISGLSKSQVANWFSNARRRQRHTNRIQSRTKIFRQGSPMPEPSFPELTPMQRWRNSPPEDEPASLSAIKKAVGSYTQQPTNRRVSHSPSSTSGDSAATSLSFLRESPSISGSSGSSYHNSDHMALYALSACSSNESALSFDQNGPNTMIIKPLGTHIFQCTFCDQKFRRKFDWVRHERSIHLPKLDKWACQVPLTSDQPLAVWRVSENNPECTLCGLVSPDEEHYKSHEFEACAERDVRERTFSRKDHLWQHLYKFHGCRKWAGWSPDLSRLKQDQSNIASRCGFCQQNLFTWDARVQHLTSHFKSGYTMSDWIGDSGINLTGLKEGNNDLSFPVV